MQVPMNPAEALLNFIIHHTDLYMRRKKGVSEDALWRAAFDALSPWLRALCDKVRAEERLAIKLELLALEKQARANAAQLPKSSRACLQWADGMGEAAARVGMRSHTSDLMSIGAEQRKENE